MRFTVESGVAHTKTAVRMSSLGMLYYRVHWFRVWFSSSVQHIPCQGQAQNHGKLANFREVTLGWEEGGSKRQLFNKRNERWLHMHSSAMQADVALRPWTLVGPAPAWRVHKAACQPHLPCVWSSSGTSRSRQAHREKRGPGTAVRSR